MAEEAAATSEQARDDSNGRNGGHKTAVRAAAIAAATGATAFAAKKAFSSRDERASGDTGSKRARFSAPGDDSMVGAMVASGWEAAKDSLVPFAEDAAAAAGDWLARNGPELVSAKLVPRFIRGFEQARGSSAEADN